MHGFMSLEVGMDMFNEFLDLFLSNKGLLVAYGCLELIIDQVQGIGNMFNGPFLRGGVTRAAL